MEYKEISVKVPRELQDVLDCLKVIVREVRKGSDVAAIISSAIPPFLTAIEGVDKIPSEVKENLKASVDAGLLFGNEVAFTFIHDAE